MGFKTTRFSGQKKAHKHKPFCPVGLRIPPDLSLGQIRRKTGTNPGFLLILHTGSPANPPGTNPGLSLGQIRGRREAQKVLVKKVYVPFSLAGTSLGLTVQKLDV